MVTSDAHNDIRKERHRLLMMLQHTYADLPSSMNLPVVNKLVVEHKSLIHDLAHVEQDLFVHRATIDDLEEASTKGGVQKQQHLYDLQEKTQELKTEFRLARSDWTILTQQRAKEALAVQRTQRRLAAQVENNLKQRMRSLAYQVTVEETAGFQAIEYLKRKLGTAESLLSTWTTRYENDVGSLTVRIAQLEEGRAACLDEMGRLEQELFREAELLGMRIESERIFQDTLLQQHSAAVSIQCAWRQHLARLRAKEIRAEVFASSRDRRIKRKSAVTAKRKV